MNQEIKVCTDPSKLSALYQESENLLAKYHAMVHNDADQSVNELSQAHDYVKKTLTEKWKKSNEFFKQHYGNRKLHDETIDR